MMKFEREPMKRAVAGAISNSLGSPFGRALGFFAFLAFAALAALAGCATGCATACAVGTAAATGTAGVAAGAGAFVVVELALSSSPM